MPKITFTIGKWLDIFMDLDAYIAKGGLLLDLPMTSLENLSPDVQKFIVERMGPEKMDRLSRFYMRLGKLGKDVQIGTACTEDEVRAMWRETAGSSSPSNESLH